MRIRGYQNGLSVDRLRCSGQLKGRIWDVEYFAKDIMDALEFIFDKELIEDETLKNNLYKAIQRIAEITREIGREE